jgi:hypothetical protein
MITLIYSVDKNEDYVTVEAVVEDSVLVYPATSMDPPEYGPALCKASFYLDEGELLPKDDDQLIEYLESLNLDWEVIPKDEYDYESEY